jgi:hypothetical protein
LPVKVRGFSLELNVTQSVLVRRPVVVFDAELIVITPLETVALDNVKAPEAPLIEATPFAPGHVVKIGAPEVLTKH